MSILKANSFIAEDRLILTVKYNMEQTVFFYCLQITLPFLFKFYFIFLTSFVVLINFIMFLFIFNFQGLSKMTTLVFNNKDREEYLTGFHKRKESRKKKAKEQIALKLKEEKLVVKKKRQEIAKKLLGDSAWVRLFLFVKFQRNNIVKLSY